MTNHMRIFIAGASGFIGRRLVAALTAQGAEIIAVSRSERKQEGAVRWIQGDVVKGGTWQSELDGCQAVINLAGEVIVGKRWSPEQKNLIRESRVKTTECLVEAIQSASVRPHVLISSSAIGLYPKNEEQALDETGPVAQDFLGEVCQAWETAAHPVTALGVRLVTLRIGVVLGLGGGALEKMLTPFKLGIGGPLGSGSQWMSWVHLDDVVGFILFALSRPDVQGAFNLTAPHPVRMSQFTDTLGRVLHRPSFFSVPAFMLHLILGEASSVVLDGQRIVPVAAEKAGYTFQFPLIGGALKNLLDK